MPSRRAIEVDFPYEQLSRVAKLESWRKEVFRPPYHIHKWWATRLGSVFRGILLAGLLDEEQDVWQHFYQRNDLSSFTVLDPFMGSGTTLGEAAKLGCRVIGCDINPVSYFLVQQALEGVDRRELGDAYHRLAQRVVPDIQPLYKSEWKGREADLLYTFWVKTILCPSCGNESRLFSKWIFAAHAYPRRHPEARCVCPRCGAIELVHYKTPDFSCTKCGHEFNPQEGPARRTTFICEHCAAEHAIAATYRKLRSPPPHRMYALMLLLSDGSKVYKQPDASDLARFEEAANRFRRSRVPYPQEEILPGFNTDQARGYNYRYWHQMFNERQLYSLGVILRGIMKEPVEGLRNHLLLLFSGVLEFNNMFCSFKGEGTGAVRHLFHHHILKPERTPLENNPWGTPKSSGTFSTLYRRRLLTAEEYCEDPFEVKPVSDGARDKSRKVFGINSPMRGRCGTSYEIFRRGEASALLLCGDSADLPIPDGSVDLVVTDPPYFDNVHYSELADFFFVWLRRALEDTSSAFSPPTSRSSAEVHGNSAQQFANALGRVLAECHRVLKRNGLLIFTFHHSRSEAWSAVATALKFAGLCVVTTHPIKAEMSVATPKHQAREPIDLDCVVVCRRRYDAPSGDGDSAPATGIGRAAELVHRFNQEGIKLSRGDIRVIVMGEYLRHSTNDSEGPGHDEAPSATRCAPPDHTIEQLYAAQQPAPGRTGPQKMLF